MTSTRAPDKAMRRRTGLPDGNVWVGVDVHVSLDVILGGHIRRVAAECARAVVTLIHADIVDTEVVWELHVCPIDHLEVVGLEGRERGGQLGLTHTSASGEGAYSVQVEDLQEESRTVTSHTHNTGGQD